MPERPNGVVLKTTVGKLTGGSNPSPSALVIINYYSKTMSKYLNHGISTPIAIGIIAVLIFVVGGGILAYQHYYIAESEDKLTSEELAQRLSECENIQDYSDQNVCYENLAIEANDPSICPDYSKDCVMKIAINQKDITICEKEYDKAWCMVIFPKLLQESSYRQNQQCYIQPIPIDIGYRHGAQSEYDYSYPNVYDNGVNDYPEDIVPESAFRHILSIPFNVSNAILRVYDSRNNTGFIRLIKYSPLNNSSELVGDIISKTGGNWGGIYMPIAISKNDSHILLKAQMGSPGAGGGSVTMGYAYLSLGSVKYDDCGYLDPEKIANQVYFYDNFSKALFYSEEKNVPSSERPGPYYNSAIKFINIITAETKTLLEEPNTIYEIIDIDEKLGVVNFKSCPWQAYRFSCPDSDRSRSIVLP